MITYKHSRPAGNPRSARRAAAGFGDDHPGAGSPGWAAAPRAEHLELVPSTTGKLFRDGLPQPVAVRSQGPIGAPPDERTARRIAARRARRDAGPRGTRSDIVLHREAGMATAEYAIATLAAVGFAALLVAVLSSGQIKGLLTSLITTALNFG